MLADDRYRPKGRTKRERTDISHEDRGRIGVEPKESKTRTQDGRRKDRQLSGSVDVRDQEIFRHQSMTGDVGDHGVRQGCNHHRTDGQPIETICKVDGIGTSDDHQNSKDNIKPSQVRRKILKKWHAQLRVVTGQGVQNQRHDERNDYLCRELLRRRKPFRPSLDEFEIVVHKPNGAKPQRRDKNQPDMGT